MDRRVEFDVERAKQLYNDGHGTATIGKMLGVHPDTIRYQLKGLVNFRPRIKKGDKLSELHISKISQAHIGVSDINPQTGHGFNFKREKLNCDYCKKEIYKKQCHLTSKNHFCSMLCHDLFRKGQNKGGKTKVNCFTCKKELVRPTWQAKNQDAKFFCNQKCNGEYKSKFLVGNEIYNYKGGYEDHPYGPGWNYIATQIRKRDKWCQLCRKTPEENGKELDVHHIYPARNFGTDYENMNRSDNLICYCASCHKIVESYFTDIFHTKELMNPVI